MRFPIPINQKIKIAIVTLGRLLLGVTFVLIGFFRACNPLIGSHMVSDYLDAAGMGFFKPLSLLLSIAFAAIEFAIGIGSLLGTNIKKTSLYTALLLGFLTPFSFYTAYYSPVEGNNQIAGIPVSDRITCWTYLISFIFATIIYLWRKYSKTIFTTRTEWAIGPVCILFSICVSGLSYLRLPLIDLTPYRNGVDLRHFIVPEKTTTESFIWNENGNFELKNPQKVVLDNDSSKITNALHIYSIKEGDVTQQIVEDKGFTFLLIAEDLASTSTSSRHELNDLYDYARDNGYKFYCLTTTNPTSPLAEEYCVESGGAEYPMLNVDGRELRKMVQSEPGLMLIKNGIIHEKWSNFYIPTFDQKLEETEYALPQGQSMRKKMFTLFLQFGAILIMILAIDWFLGLLKWIWRKLRGTDKKKAEARVAESSTTATANEEPQTTQTNE